MEDIEKLKQKIENRKSLMLYNKELEKEYERDIEAIENLINKNKELEKERDGIYADYQDLGKEKLELETMVERMADYIASDDCEWLCTYCVSSKYCDRELEAKKECLLEHFRKKAKGE